MRYDRGRSFWINRKLPRHCLGLLVNLPLGLGTCIAPQQPRMLVFGFPLDLGLAHNEATVLCAIPCQEQRRCRVSAYAKPNPPCAIFQVQIVCLPLSDNLRSSRWANPQSAMYTLGNVLSSWLKKNSGQATWPDVVDAQQRI